MYGIIFCEALEVLFPNLRFLILASTELFAVCLRVTVSVIAGYLALSPPVVATLILLLHKNQLVYAVKSLKKAVNFFHVASGRVYPWSS